MKINNDNKKAIHDVLITDMQKRLYEDGKGTVGFTNDNEYTSHLEVLVDEILLTQSLDDINDLLIRYSNLFDEPMTIDTNIFTLEGTLNYIIALLVSEIQSLEQAYEFNDMFN
jgi:hypothetical protein